MGSCCKYTGFHIQNKIKDHKIIDLSQMSNLFVAHLWGKCAKKLFFLCKNLHTSIKMCSFAPDFELESNL